jgi:hypothetical protein
MMRDGSDLPLVTVPATAANNETASHTPGPWAWDDGRCVLRNAADTTLSVLAIDLPEFIEEPDKVLVGAAPELLEALKLALKYVAVISIDRYCEQLLPNATADHETIRAAILKAEGRTHPEEEGP